MTTPTDQDLADLRASVRSVLERRGGIESVRRVTENGPGADLELWHTLATDVGVAALVVPEEHGGLDAGPAAVRAVGEELGAALAAVPFLSSAVLAASAFAAHAGHPLSTRWLPQLAAGRIGTVALTGEDGRAGAPGVRAARSSQGFELSGSAGYVLDTEFADVVVVAADGPDGPLLVVVSPGSLRREATLVHDRTRRLSRIGLDGVTVGADAILAEGAEAAATIEELYRRAGAALAADAAGGARMIHETAVEYAKQRVQFGRPIGSFQAVKHKLADMFVLVEAMSAAAEHAATAVGEQDPRTAALTTAYTLEGYLSVAGDAIQVHGGIGYTWEHVCHLVFKRAQLDEALLGSAAWHRELSAAEMLAAG